MVPLRSPVHCLGEQRELLWGHLREDGRSAVTARVDIWPLAEQRGVRVGRQREARDTLGLPLCDERCAECAGGGWCFRSVGRLHRAQDRSEQRRRQDGVRVQEPVPRTVRWAAERIERRNGQNIPLLRLSGGEQPRFERVSGLQRLCSGRRGVCKGRGHALAIPVPPRGTVALIMGEN